MNKYWTFEKHEKSGIKKEVIYFLIITFVGLVIDVIIFWYIVSQLGPQFGMNVKIWTELAVIMAAFASAVWNFLGYKFIVFKK